MKRETVEIGSGNVFEDLGFGDAQELLTKAELTRQIFGILKSRRLTQQAAAKLIGISKPAVSADRKSVV